LFFILPQPPHSTLFPYTTLFRSQLAVAKSTHDESVKKLLAVARDNGIEAKYIQTGRMVMRPEYSQKKFIGYQVSQDLSLTLKDRSEEHTSELQSQSNLVCRLLLE